MSSSLFKSVVRFIGGFISFGVGSCAEVQIGRLILGWVDFYPVGFLLAISQSLKGQKFRAIFHDFQILQMCQGSLD